MSLVHYSSDGGTTWVAARSSVPFSTSHLHAPASNTAAVVTLTAGGSGRYNVIDGIYWSYDAAPTGGSLKIEDGSGTTVFHVAVTAAGPGFFVFPRPMRGSANTALIVTLAAGGVGITGKVGVFAGRVE